MSDAAKFHKVRSFITSVPGWLWLSSSASVVLFAGFLYYLSLQTPDQYAMTMYPPWQHGMNYKELLAYHRAIKSGAFDGTEFEAKPFLYRQGQSQQVYASNESNTYRPSNLPQRSPNQPLSIDDIAGFASRSQPVNQYSFNQAQQNINQSRRQYDRQFAANVPAGIYVQTASLRSPRDADQLQRELENRGFSPFIQQAIVQNQRWYRVRFGPFGSMADAKQLAGTLKAKRYDAQVVHNK